ncbi:MAG: DUF898 family protein, partial [Aestuariivirga sp.]
MTESPSNPPIHLEFAYVPRPGLLKIAVVNFLLGLITLTIFRFWAKARVRRHIWSCIHINGEPLEYTGTGAELFRGFLMVFGLFILPYIVLAAALGFWLGPNDPSLAGLQGLFFLLVYLLWGFALYKQRKYQLSRTLWRGIRGTLAGSAFTYSLTYFGSLLAKGMSLGWATPVMDTVLQEQMIGNMQFGDISFKFKGRAGPLYPTYAACWFLTLLALVIGAVWVGMEFYSVIGTEISAAFDRVFREKNDLPKPTADDYWTVWRIIGLIGASVFAIILVVPLLWTIYTTKKMRYFANCTRFDGAQFKLEATAGSYAWLIVGNVLLAIFTLGIGAPFIAQR